MDMPPDTAIARPRVETWHEDEASYQLLFLHHPTPMWFMDEVTLAFLEVNEAAIRHYGYSRDEFSRMTILDIRLPEEVPIELDHGQRPYAAPGRSASGRPTCGATVPRTVRSSMSTSSGAQSSFGGAKLASS